MSWRRSERHTRTAASLAIVGLVTVTVLGAWGRRPGFREDFGLREEIAAWPALIAFYIGRQDSRVLGINVQFDREPTRNRIKHISRIYPGGHSASLWQSQAPQWLGMALDALSAEAEHRCLAPAR